MRKARGRPTVNGLGAESNPGLFISLMTDGFPAQPGELN